MFSAGLPSNVRSRSKIAPVSCAKARLTRRALSSRRLPHIRQRAEFSLPCLGVYHWLRTQAPLTPARQDRSSYATFASAHLRHGALASLGNIDCSSLARARWRITRAVTAPFPCVRSFRPPPWARPSIRRVFLRSLCARRLIVVSLNNLQPLPRFCKLSYARRKYVAVRL